MGRYKAVRLRDQQGKPFGVVDKKTGRIVSKTTSKAAQQYDGVYLSEGKSAAQKHVPRNKRE